MTCEIVLPIKCSTVKKLNDELPMVIFYESIVWAVVSWVAYLFIIFTDMHVRLNYFTICLAVIQTFGIMWGVVVFVAAGGMCLERIRVATESLKIGDVMEYYAAKLVYGIEDVINSIINSLPTFSCIKDIKEEEKHVR